MCPLTDAYPRSKRVRCCCVVRLVQPVRLITLSYDPLQTSAQGRESRGTHFIASWRLGPPWCTRTRDSGVARVIYGPRSTRTYLVRTWASARRTSAPSVVAAAALSSLTMTSCKFAAPEPDTGPVVQLCMQVMRRLSDGAVMSKLVSLN